MHVGRFHGVLQDIRYEYSKYSIVNELQILHEDLSNAIRDQDSETTSEFKSQYEKVLSFLSECPSNNFSPTKKMMLDEINAHEYVGNGLKSRITVIIDSNRVTPASALTDLEELNEKIEKYIQTIESICHELDWLGISPTYLKGGEFEGAVSIPKESINSTLEDLSKEFLKVDTFVKTIKEIVGDDPTSPAIKTITSSEWQVFLEFLPEAAACSALAIERIVALYKNHLEIKKLKKDMEDKDLPETITKPMQEYVDGIVEKKLKEISEEVVNEFYKNDDEGRKNELKIKLSRSLKYVAQRIDHGTTFQIDVGIPRRPKENEENPGVGAEEIANYETVLKHANYVKQRSVEISDLERLESPMLMITDRPESDDENENEDKKSNN